MTSDDIRYSRQITLPAIGKAGQERLHDASILIIGAGGLGAPASLYLASSGVGQLLINDFDTVDSSNLPRQILFREKDTGDGKATTTIERLQEINPDMKAIAGLVGFSWPSAGSCRSRPSRYVWRSTPVSCWRHSGSATDCWPSSIGGAETSSRDGRRSWS